MAISLDFPKDKNMSSIKRYLEEMEDPDRIAPQPGRYVSAACFEDRALQKFVRQNLTINECSYYSGPKTPPKGAPLDVVIRFILGGLYSRYDDANNGVGWEGGYVGAVTYDSDDLVREHVELTQDAHDRLCDDIAYALPDRTWSEKDPYAARDHQVMTWSWEAFVEVVKHQRRYFFGNSKRTEDDETVSPSELLAVIARKCVQARMIRKIPIGTIFYRCRWRKKGEHFTKPNELGPPPRERASQSRMSPAGIPMFYGARDKVTARAETLASDTARHSMAAFHIGKNIRVLDLTKSPNVSIFETNSRSLYEWAIFMRRFESEIRKIVTKDGAEHIDYVPTQIVTEYFRSFLRNSKGKPIDGILYRSAANDGGECLALFADQSDVDPERQQPGSGPSGYLLQLLSATDDR